MTDPTHVPGQGRYDPPPGQSQPPLPPVPRVPDGPDTLRPGGAPAQHAAPPLPGTATPPPVPPTSPPRTGQGGPGSADTSGVADTAKQEGRRVAGEAQESAQRLAGEAKDEGRKVVRETKNQARELYHRTMAEVSEQASTQQERIADGLLEAGSQLDEMSQATDREGLAPALVSEAASRAEEVGRWLRQRDPEGVLDEVKRFARRRPVAFIAIAAVAGIVVGRLTRGLVEDAKQGHESSSSSGSRGQHAAPMSREPRGAAAPPPAGGGTPPPPSGSVGNVADAPYGEANLRPGIGDPL